MHKPGEAREPRARPQGPLPLGQLCPHGAEDTPVPRCAPGSNRDQALTSQNPSSLKTKPQIADQTPGEPYSKGLSLTASDTVSRGQRSLQSPRSRERLTTGPSPQVHGVVKEMLRSGACGGPETEQLGQSALSDEHTGLSRGPGWGGQNEDRRRGLGGLRQVMGDGAG